MKAKIYVRPEHYIKNVLFIVSLLACVGLSVLALGNLAVNSTQTPVSEMKSLDNNSDKVANRYRVKRHKRKKYLYA